MSRYVQWGHKLRKTDRRKIKVLSPSKVLGKKMRKLEKSAWGGTGFKKEAVSRPRFLGKMGVRGRKDAAI